MTQNTDTGKSVLIVQFQRSPETRTSFFVSASLSLWSPLLLLYLSGLTIGFLFPLAPLQPFGPVLCLPFFRPPLPVCPELGSYLRVYVVPLSA